jgi:Beta-lactamase
VGSRGGRPEPTAQQIKTIFSFVASRNDFRLASGTKQFTAMAIMLLVHDGKLKCSDRLTDIFLDFPAYGQSSCARFHRTTLEYSDRGMILISELSLLYATSRVGSVEVA